MLPSTPNIKKQKKELIEKWNTRHQSEQSRLLNEFVEAYNLEYELRMNYSPMADDADLWRLEIKKAEQRTIFAWQAYQQSKEGV